MSLWYLTWQQEPLWAWDEGWVPNSDHTLGRAASFFHHPQVSRAKYEAEKRILRMCRAKCSQMQAQMAAPTLRYLLPVLFTVSEPSSESDAEYVFAVYVQRDWSSYFRTGVGMEEQSFVLITNLNTTFFFYLQHQQIHL